MGIIGLYNEGLLAFLDRFINHSLSEIGRGQICMSLVVIRL